MADDFFLTVHSVSVDSVFAAFLRLLSCLFASICNALFYREALYCSAMCCNTLHRSVTILNYCELCCIVLHCSVVLYCTILYYTVLYCTVLYCTALYCTVLYCTVLLSQKLNNTAVVHLLPLLRLT
jgi:hypothetical protein